MTKPIHCRRCYEDTDKWARAWHERRDGSFANSLRDRKKQYVAYGAKVMSKKAKPTHASPRWRFVGNSIERTRRANQPVVETL